MDKEKEPASYALLDSLFYLGQTEIPVRSRYGENVVLYNHKNRMVLGIDKEGRSYLEANGVYTTESVTSQLVKNSVGVTVDHKGDGGEKKSVFRSLLSGGAQAAPVKNKRVSMGILPVISNNVISTGGGSAEVSLASATRYDMIPFYTGIRCNPNPKKVGSLTQYTYLFHANTLAWPNIYSTKTIFTTNELVPRKVSKRSRTRQVIYNPRSTNTRKE
jgi:hypothetical protein